MKLTRRDSLCLVKDILMTEGPSAVIIVRQGGFYIVKEIVHMFEHFTREDESGDESHCPLFCGKKGCKIYDCIDSRIAQFVLDISNLDWISQEEWKQLLLEYSLNS